MYLPLLSRENSGEFYVNIIQTKMSELLEAIVREAKKRSFEEFDRELKWQRQTISDLKESIGMIQRQLRNADANLTQHPTIRTSPRDIRNFRRKLGITQEVFAQMLHVNIRTDFETRRHVLLRKSENLIFWRFSEICPPFRTGSLPV